MTSDLHDHPVPPGAASDPQAREPSRREAGPRETGLRESGGWLAQLRARLGLSGPQSLRETLTAALRENDPDSGFSAEEREMLLRLLRFSGSRVDDVMVPRADIIAVEEGAALSELLARFEAAGVSRLPIYRETLDDPRGMIHIKDLFQWLLAGSGEREAREPELALGRCDLGRPISVAKIRRPVLYVPPSMPAMNLLIRMQSTRIHMALVVDEYGGTDGLVTIEDLVEQVVGDIEDEHDDKAAAHIVRDAKHGLIASARTPVGELETHLGIKLLSAGEEEDIDTLGGLVFAIVGRVPSRGEIVRHASGLEFEVLDADPRRVKTLRIHRPRPPVTGVPAAAPSAGPDPGAPAAPDSTEPVAPGLAAASAPKPAGEAPRASEPPPSGKSP